MVKANMNKRSPRSQILIEGCQIDLHILVMLFNLMQLRNIASLISVISYMISMAKASMNKRSPRSQILIAGCQIDLHILVMPLITCN